MNKEYGALLMASLISSTLLFSMHNAPKFIYYGSKILATSALPFVTMSILHKAAKATEEEIASLPDVKSKSPIVCEWAEDIIGKAGGSQYDISLKYGEQWASGSHKNKKYIKLPFTESLLLESALKQRRNANLRQKMTFFEKFKEDFFGSSDEAVITNYDQYIDESSMVLRHEIGHAVANDAENAQRMKLGIPVGLETICFGATYTFNKLCKISPPKTIMKSLGRSVLVFGGIIPKALCFPHIYFAYSRYLETEADKFSCENAETIKELEAFHGRRKRHQTDFERQCHLEQLVHKELTEADLRSKHKKFDPCHPYPADRADMVQKYINEWDIKHPGDKH